MKQSIYKRSKNLWNDVQEAQADVCAKQQISNENLSEAHTEKHWAWNNSTFWAKTSTSKKSEFTEQKAIILAMDSLQTFENNLQTDHTAENWVFRKIRG